MIKNVSSYFFFLWGAPNFIYRSHAYQKQASVYQSSFSNYRNKGNVIILAVRPRFDCHTGLASGRVLTTTDNKTVSVKGNGIDVTVRGCPCCTCREIIFQVSSVNREDNLHVFSGSGAYRKKNAGKGNIVLRQCLVGRETDISILGGCHQR